MNYSVGIPKETPVNCATTGTPPCLGEQLAKLEDALYELTHDLNRLSLFVINCSFDVEKREGEELTAYLAWAHNTIRRSDDRLRNIADLIR